VLQFNDHDAIFIYRIFSGVHKDYYFSMETKARGQRFLMCKFSMYEDQGFEKEARKSLIDKGNFYPTYAAVAQELNLMFKPLV